MLASVSLHVPCMQRRKLVLAMACSTNKAALHHAEHTACITCSRLQRKHRLLHTADHPSKKSLAWLMQSRTGSSGQ